jgi:hydrogenase maturation protease
LLIGAKDSSMKHELAAAVAPCEAETRASSVLVLGLGNPILGDDGVGWRVAEQVRSATAGQAQAADVDCAALGGLSLMERMLGYGRVILVDSMWTGTCPEGSVSVCSLDDLVNPGAGHTASPHDTSLVTALRTAELMGAEVPHRVDIVAIETRACYDFSEALTPSATSALPIATRKVLELLGELCAPDNRGT